MTTCLLLEIGNWPWHPSPFLNFSVALHSTLDKNLNFLDKSFDDKDLVYLFCFSWPESQMELAFLKPTLAPVLFLNCCLLEGRYVIVPFSGKDSVSPLSPCLCQSSSGLPPHHLAAVTPQCSVLCAKSVHFVGWAAWPIFLSPSAELSKMVGQMKWWVCTFSQPAWKCLPRWTVWIPWLRSKGLLLTLAVPGPRL